MTSFDPSGRGEPAIARSRIRPPARSRARGFAAIVAAAAVIASGALTALPANAADADLARYGTITADKTQNDTGTNGGYFPASNAIDGNDATRWASGNGPNSAAAVYTAVLTEDLGSAATLTGARIVWEAAYATGYRFEVASVAPDQAASWRQVFATTTGTGKTETVSFAYADAPGDPVTARYVRLNLDQRVAIGTSYYGYSIFTLGLFGTFATPQAGFGTLAPSVAGGDVATVPVVLSNASDTDQTIHVTSADGTARAGVDYTAVDQDITIPAGATAANVTVTTTAQGPLAPTRTLKLTLSAPSGGIALNASLAAATLTVTPKGAIPNVGGTTRIDGFESGVPSSYAVWANGAANNPVLSTAVDAGIPGSDPANHALVATVNTTSSYFGFTYEPRNPDGSNLLLDWSRYDGFSFWFLGKNTGKTFSYELHNRNASNTEQGFTANVVDNVAGWRKISVLFKDVKAKSGNTLQTFNPSISTGFAVTLTGFGATGAYVFDDFSLFQRATTLDDFEAPFAPAEPGQPGYSTTGTGVTDFGVTAQARGDLADNRVLSGVYQVPAGGDAGVDDRLAYSQDWSGFRGIRFWWYASQPTEPASATTGSDIAVRIADRGPDADHAEVWTASFRDNWANGSRWKLVELPFSSFVAADDALQHGDEATRDGVLDLTATWGLSLAFPAGTAATPFSIDDVQLYGIPTLQTDVTVSIPDVTLVDAGEAAHVALTLTTATGNATTSAVAVKYATGTTAAKNGTDYTAVSGTLTFPVGTASGTTLTFDVPTLPGAAEAKALSIPLTVTNPAITLPLTAPIVVINAHGYPYLDASLDTGARVADLLGRMSLADKVGQMTQAERGSISNPRQIAQLGLGSILSGGGSVPSGNTPAAWQAMVDGFQSEALAAPLQIPIVYGAPAVHGHSNVKNATIYPHNLGLGATRDPALVQQIGQETASETRTTGVTWAFSPCLCVTRDERWGRTYESFGEDPALVSSFSRATIEGLQGSDPSDKSGADEVLASAKHWAGDGGTAYDQSKAGTGAYPIDQGITKVATEQEFETLFAAPYVPAIAAGVGTIMPSYSSLSVNGSTPIKMTANKALDTDLLKGTMGFDGFLISDWQAIGQIPGGSYADKAIVAVNAGLDMAMEPSNYTGFINAILAGVASGAVAQDRVDDAVARILTQKFELGLFESPFTDASQRDEFGGAEHRATAAQAAAESQVLLKNTEGALPLAKDAKLYVAGSNADDLGNQMGGWTLSWQGGSGKGMTAGTTILEGLKAELGADNVTFSKTATAATDGFTQGLVVVGETPYAEGQGDVGNNGRTLNLSAADTAAINTVCAAMECTVLVVSGRPLFIGSVVGQADAVVAGFLPGSEGQGVAEVLVGDTPFTGRLPLTWPTSLAQLPINVGDAVYDPEFAYGWGLRTDAPLDRLSGLVDGLDGAALTSVQALIDADVWAEDGTLANAQAGLRLAAAAAATLSQVAKSVVDGASVQTAQQHPIDTAKLAQADVVVSIVRDLAQQAILAQGAEPAQADVAATADAEHYLVSGDAVDAVRLLASVAGVDVTTPVAAAPTATTAPSISGTAQVGQTLTADPGTWSLDGVTFAYRWSVGGVPVADATGDAYTPKTADVGKKVTVTVTASKLGYADGTAVSAEAGPVIPVPPTTPSITVKTKPAIKGTARVGEQLSASSGSWSVSGVSYRYQWKADGKSIAGATRSTFTPTAAQAGAAITVTVTASKKGYTDGTATSAATSAVALGAAAKYLLGPVVLGSGKVGATLRALPGLWLPLNYTPKYQWLRDGAAVSGATGSRYVLTAADAGHKVAVKVSLVRAGYATASSTSSAVKVSAGTIRATSKPTISGTPEVGRTLTAKSGKWSVAKVSVSYQWYANGSAVKGATGSTFTPTSSQVGKRITVVATARLAGYQDGSATSAATRAVTKKR